MNPSGVVASSFPPRVMKITTFSLLLLLSAAASVHAQAQQPQRPTSREAARPGTSQGFSAGCTTSRLIRVASRAQCHFHLCRVLDLRN